MFGMGMTELLVVLAVALLVLGPKRLPELASSLGKMIREFRKATRDLTDQMEIDESIRKPVAELRAALRDDPPPAPAKPLIDMKVPEGAIAKKDAITDEAAKIDEKLLAKVEVKTEAPAEKPEAKADGAPDAVAALPAKA